MAVASLLGAALAVSPTGTPVVDQLWCGAFVGVLAWVGGHARRAVVLVVAAAAAALAGTSTALAFAAVAVGVAVLQARRAQGSRRRSALASAAIALSLLTGSGPEARWLALATTAGAAGLLLWSGGRALSPHRRRAARRSAIVLATTVCVAVALAGMAGLLARTDLDRGLGDFRAATHAARTGDTELAAARFHAAGNALGHGRRYLVTLGLPAWAVPGLAQQVRAGAIAADVAADTAEVASRTSSRLSLDDLEVRAGAVDLTSIAAAQAPLDELVAGLDHALRRLERIDRTVLLPPVSAALVDALVEATAAGRDAERLQRGVRSAPDLLGADERRRYLVLFTTPVEARNRFGFPGSYAVFVLDQGRISFERSGPIAELIPAAGFDQGDLTIPVGAQPYLAFGVSRAWQSVTIPPDFTAVADLAAQLAAQTPAGPIDGVVLAAPEVVAAMVALTGDVPLPGLDVVLTPETTVDFLTRRQYLELPSSDEQAERRDILADVAEVVGRRLESASLPALDSLVDTFSPLLAADQLAVSVPVPTSPEVAAFLSDSGADGGLRIDGDVLHVGHINAVGNKIDLFLRRSLRYEVDVSEEGSLEAALTMTLENSAPASGLPDYLLASSLTEVDLPLGTNRSTLLLYSPHELVELRIDGTPTPFTAIVDGDLFAYQVQLDLAPGQRRTIDARLTGRDVAIPYQLTVLPSGLAQPDEVTVAISDGKADPVEESATVTSPVLFRPGSR